MDPEEKSKEQKRRNSFKKIKKVLCVNSPNKEERHLTILLNKVLPNEYKFVGNGKLRVGRKFPDFVNKAKTKLIELYGDYYHKGQNPQDRIDYFKQYGYDTLVIWASKLYQNEKLVMDTIINFNKSK